MNTQELTKRIKKWYRGLPDKKRYAEFATALLSIPVLISVLLLNYTNLSSQKKEATPAPTEKPPVIITVTAPNNGGGQQTILPTAAPAPSCKKSVGPISISYPKQNQTVSDSPLCISVSYTVGEYCSAVWSYRINDDAWSDYTDKDICIYNMTSGEKKVQLRVKSVVSSDEDTLERTFIYESKNPTPQASPSAQ